MDDLCGLVPDLLSLTLDELAADQDAARLVAAVLRRDEEPVAVASFNACI